MKNLANCTPREFLIQTNKIRRYAADWMDTTKIMEIRRRKPAFTGKETEAERSEKLQAQAKQNISDMLDSVMETNVDQSVVLLGMICFVEPEDIDNHPVYEYLGSFADIINCPEVLGFFTSLMQLGQMNIFGTAQA